MIGAVPGQKLFDKMAASPEALAEEALALRPALPMRPLPWCATCRARIPEGDAYFQFARNMVKGMAKNFPAPASAWTPWRPPPSASLPMAWRTSASCSST